MVKKYNLINTYSENDSDGVQDGISDNTTHNDKDEVASNQIKSLNSTTLIRINLVSYNKHNRILLLIFSTITSVILIVATTHYLSQPYHVSVNLWTRSHFLEREQTTRTINLYALEK